MSFKKWALRGLNPGPADYESDALTSELSALIELAGAAGFEPTTAGVTTRCICL